MSLIGSPKTAEEELMWFFGVLVLMWIVWYFTGGPERAATAKPFIKPPDQQGQYEQYDAKRGINDLKDIAN